MHFKFHEGGMQDMFYPKTLCFDMWNTDMKTGHVIDFDTQTLVMWKNISI